MPKRIYVKITGTGLNETFQALSHEMIDMRAATYHLFTMPDGTKVYWNDFGIRTIIIADSIDKLN